MQVAIEISMYPLTSEFNQLVIDFITDLRSKGHLVIVNGMSTQIFGEFNEVHSHLFACIQRVYENETKAVFNLKVLNNPLPHDFTL